MEKGIYCVVEVKSRNPAKLKYDKNYNFWLPQQTLQAAKKLRMLLFENRTYNPPVSDAELNKKVTFYIKGLEHVNIGFLSLVVGLHKANINVEIKGVDENVV